MIKVLIQKKASIIRIMQKVSEVVLRGEAVGILICGPASASAWPPIATRASVQLFVKMNLPLVWPGPYDANILCMGGRVVGTALAESIVNTFLSTSFEGDDTLVEWIKSNDRRSICPIRRCWR